MDTIFAVASGMQRAGVAIIRVSGPTALLTYKNLTHRPVPLARMATFGSFRDPSSRALLDKGMALYFPKPASFTGEDVMEYHLHGGAAVVKGFLEVLSRQPDCRLAEPGEFTRRAFENGKIDLTAAEAVADLVDAETEAQRTQALEQLAGHLARLYEGWAAVLQKILSHQEAEIEFPDEDMPEKLANSLIPEIDALIGEIRAHLDDGRRGERLRTGVLIAIVGAPNAGKSSLLNALAQRDAAIVSEEAGTTRDVVEVHLDLGGYPVILADTAGLRETAGKVEAEGIRRAKKIAAQADIKLVLFDGTHAPDMETQRMTDDDAIVVMTKADLKNFSAPGDALAVSSVSGAGVDQLLKTLTQRVSGLFGAKNGPSLTRERHRAALRETVEALARSRAAVLPELAAEDLRLALRALGRITGRVHVEELLDRIFKDFCIGK